MAKVKILIFSGYGLNCEEETKNAFEIGGGTADIIHINDLIERKNLLKKYQIIAIPGGFSYGDDTGSGNAYAIKIKNHLWDEILEFINKDRLIIGICNGFQILVNLGLLPALNNNYGKREVALIHNNFPRYTVRWVDLKIKNKISPWLYETNTISLPIAHGEGKFFAKKEILTQIKNKNLIALEYSKGEIHYLYSLPVNPNGSLLNIAGITNETGKILGLMPHPERAIFFHQLPHWFYLKEKYYRENKKIPKEGPGLKIFENGVKYFL